MHIKDSFPELYKIRRPLKREEARARLDAKQGKEYWRSLEELAGSPEFDEFLHREFPGQAGEWDDPVGRRSFIKLMGASLALAGLSGCVYQPPETVVPYVRQPEEIVAGKPLFFATAMPFSGGATGLLVRSNEGRPTHVEGNELHPGSLGATDIYSIASILTLYDPDRSETIYNRDEIRPYTAFLADIHTALDGLRSKQGAGLRFLTEPVTSPTLAAQLKAILAAMPGAKWHQYEPAGMHGAAMGAQLAFGEPVNVVYHFDKADRILALDSDFLACGPASLRYARDFAARRRLTEGRNEMSRLYAVETTPTNTGAVADHRFALRPSEMEMFGRALASALGASGISAPTGTAAHADQIAAIAKDFQAARGKSIVIAGDYAAPAVHALAHAMNQALGNIGQTVTYTEPIEANPVDQIGDLRQLMGDIDAGQVELLVVIGGNPVYNAPADLAFTQERLAKIKLRVRLGLYNDETSELCHWHIPEAHFLEAWSDTRAYDGTASIVQPLIAPLYHGKSAHELLAAFTDQPEKSGYDIVRDYWRTQNLGGDFETAWRRAVHDGIIPNTAAKEKTVTVKTDWANQPAAQASTGNAQFEIIFRPDPSVYDGRFANNGWLQELPKPITKLTWDTAAHISPKTARDKFGLDFGSDINNVTAKGGELYMPVVELKMQGRTARFPLLILPGQPDDTVTVHLGYGRRKAGHVGTMNADQSKDFNFQNAYAIRTSDALWSAPNVELNKTGDEYNLAITQLHFNMEGRAIVRTAPLEEYKKHPSFARDEEPDPPNEETLYPNHEYTGYKWAMAIDTHSCVGCNACVIACQSENNIPVVGKEQVARSREMHWIRIDAYFKGLAENPEGVHFMPVPCMHCEDAPCEVVCPVNATVHSAEGTNDMVYNRCVGTRYCSNNCPYKVRRFNFLLYQDFNTPSLKLMRNPEVTVRSRGVMEKCTYCVQRIQNAKIESEKENRQVRDGEIQTACMAACPTEAIIFGDLNDQKSLVKKLKDEPRNYSLLGELNTKPRTTYLASVRNPNPDIQRA